ITPNKPGALAESLAVFRDHEINLVKLESRPIENRSWEELFYVDLDGNLDEKNIKTALDELRRKVKFLKILGCYPAQDLPAVEARGVQSKTKPVTAKEIEPQQAPAAVIKNGDKSLLHSRVNKTEDTLIELPGCTLGGDNFVTIAGPCSVESREQIIECAGQAKEQGAKILRGGCFKPRTSPYSFQGLGVEGLRYLREAGDAYELPVVTEVMTAEDVTVVAQHADILQIGARNMQNFALLKAVGLTKRPVMLKRGLMASLEELLYAAEYILSQGNQQVFLCERGIRTFETATRNTLDISAIPILKERTHLPVIVDPSHAVGSRRFVAPLSFAAKAVGAHGIMVEFHPDPEKALSDGPQALNFSQFADMMQNLSVQ
ncbi:MAG: 3-deoxy-7-phosphoheptulonate synthase, partial [Gammaproteobacteria bacterium]|nr:3-deoxy-7-phosphoheptulonate synthase [Gammaproteobacteria bacterium]